MGKTRSSWGLTDQLANTCPEAVNPNHRMGPSGYIARDEWSDNMSKTHVQSQCPRCELWVIWTPKKRAVGKMGLSGNLRVDNR